MAMTHRPVEEEATIVLSGIGADLTDGMLMNMYRTYGPIVRVRHNGTNSAQVIFTQVQHAQRAVEATNGAVVYGKTLKVSLQRKFRKTTEPCRGFAAGICRKGDMCKYFHGTDDVVFTSSAPRTVAKAPREPKKKTPKPKPAALVVQSEAASITSKQLCRHFTRGYCEKGAECVFAHVLGVPKDAVSAPTGKVAQLCQFYLSGVCNRGDNCRFIHDPKVGAVPEKAAASKASAQSSSSDDESGSGAETKQDEETRTCVECEKPGVAVWKCAKCDNSLYCDDCNSAVHRARVMAKHKRTKLPPVPKLPRCGECESKPATVRCKQCEVPFCASCDTSVHKFKSLRKHTRAKLLGNTEKTQSKTKEPKEDPKPAKNEEKKKKTPVVESVPQTKVIEPVTYVESVPQLDFSSESESSDSEDEEMAEATPVQTTSTSADGEDEPMPAVSHETETESDEDFDDVKTHSSVPVASTPAEQSAESAESESENDFDDKPAAKSTPPPASVPKLELSSDSDSSDDEAPEPATKSSSEAESESEDEVPFKPAAKPTPAPARKLDLAELSSESESDSDEKVPSKPAVKQTKKPAPKAVPAPSTSESSSDDSEDEAPSKPAAKTKTAPASKPVATKTSSSSSESSESSSSESSDSSEDEAPAKPAAKATPAPRRAPAPARGNKSGGISEGSSHTLVKKIELFNESGEGDELHLDANLNGFERLLAHDCAERLGLAHESKGSGLERHIIISRHGAKRPAVDSGHGLKSKKSKHRH